MTIQLIACPNVYSTNYYSQVGLLLSNVLKMNGLTPKSDHYEKLEQQKNIRDQKEEKNGNKNRAVLQLQDNLHVNPLLRVAVEEPSSPPQLTSQPSLKS